MWGVFGTLVLASVLCLLQAFAVVGLTPVKVYDSAESIPKLPDNDISALCHSVSRYTCRVAGYSSAVVIAWALFAGLVLVVRRPATHSQENESKNIG